MEYRTTLISIAFFTELPVLVGRGFTPNSPQSEPVTRSCIFQPRYKVAGSIHVIKHACGQTFSGRPRFLIRPRDALVVIVIIHKLQHRFHFRRPF